jgi:hypothetical protein
MTTENEKAILGTVNLSPFGVDIVLTKENGARDYAEMRAAQLAALTTFISITSGQSGNALEDFSTTIQNNVLWLVSTMAQEVSELIPIVVEEAQNRGAHREKQGANETKHNVNAGKIRTLKEASHATT